MCFCEYYVLEEKACCCEPTSSRNETKKPKSNWHVPYNYPCESLTSSKASDFHLFLKNMAWFSTFLPAGLTFLFS